MTSDPVAAPPEDMVEHTALDGSGRRGPEAQCTVVDPWGDGAVDTAAKERPSVSGGLLGA